jgi:hypothetical protein
MSTKFLRKSTRRLIRDFDQFQNAYPQLLRSSDPINNGIDLDTRFEDSRALIFNVSNNVSFPVMLPAGMTTLPSSSINANVEIHAAAVEQRPSLPGSIESLEPFNETTFNLPATYENTASIAFAPGFNISTRNKIGIPIDITATREKNLFRLGLIDTNADSQGYFYGQASTGFCYYNFDLKRWEDIGLNNNSYVGYMGNVTPADETTFSGQNYFMAQFVGTPNRIGRPVMGTPYEADTIAYTGYNKIGSPTEFFDAPGAPRYHATSSQGLSMSSYIQQPFVLERVDVTIPFVARRKHGNQIGGATDPYESSLRDIDNLVFFVYRQAGNDNRETSQRFLISHESLTFYNSAINGNANFLTHNPAFSYDYQLSVSSSQEGLFTGSISFSMYPKVTSPNFGGVTAYSVYDTSGSDFRRAGVLNFWTGPMLSTISSSINTVDGQLDPSGNNTFWRIKNTTNTELVFDAQLNPDQRFLTNLATGSLLPTVAGSTSIGPAPYEELNSINWSQNNTPYVLLPEDSLIFGLESDICTRSTANGTYANGADKSPLSVTSSFFKILTDSAQVTLYGSLVQNGVAKTANSINQNLVSPAVHEIIANTQDDTDQFDIAEKDLYVGTYLDNFITGTMENGTRGVAQSLIDGPLIKSGSFLKYNIATDGEKTYYQNGPSVIKIGPPPFTSYFDIAYSDPKKPKNYYRVDRYGNYRDMLEQAKDYRIFNKLLYKKNGGFEDAGPAYAKFVLSSSEVPTSASLTFCNNLSPYMTGTFPFDDNSITSTSRDAYPTSVSNSPFVPTTLIFKT